MRVLSGGEKVRVLLSRMMIQASNVLILDEPTDHLDMESITALNNGLIKFPGVILFASRDHQVVQTTANRIIEFLPDGTFVDKVSSYDEYLEMMRWLVNVRFTACLMMMLLITKRRMIYFQIISFHFADVPYWCIGNFLSEPQVIPL